jgi:FkbM family methyltransferase
LTGPNTDFMNSRISQIAFRADVVRLKTTGKLPQLSWMDVASTWFTSCTQWPAEKLAIPANGGDPVIYETPIGQLCWSRGLRRYAGLFALEHMRGVYEHGSVRLNSGDVVVDLGANIGSFSRYALSRGAKLVIAFEPEPSHIAFLEQCFAAEIRDGRMKIVKAAAWKEKTKLRFEPNMVESRVSDTGSLEVQAVTVDETMQELGVPKVDFIKADIEGAERHALAGAKQTITTSGPKMALCTYHLPDDPQTIPAIVQSFRSYDVRFNVGRSQAFFAARARS